MALPSSGEISLGSIRDEYQDNNPASMSEYYGVGVDVPVSGELTIADFYGTSRLIKEVTVGNESFWWGYNDGTVYTNLSSFGSISPTTYKSYEIIYAIRLANWWIAIEGNHPQNLFTAVTPEGGVRLPSSASNHGYFSEFDVTSWNWNGNDYPVSGWNGTNPTRLITFED